MTSKELEDRLEELYKLQNTINARIFSGSCAGCHCRSCRLCLMCNQPSHAEDSECTLNQLSNLMIEAIHEQKTSIALHFDEEE